MSKELMISFFVVCLIIFLASAPIGYIIGLKLIKIIKEKFKEG